jgi:hypothetical protein
MSDGRAFETDEQTVEPAQGKPEPTVIAAPERKGRCDLTVVRQTGETDADYKARCKYIALLLDAVETGWVGSRFGPAA